ncbi:hypothetical protein [Bradyrhizobium sp. SSUT77]|uniref:hypothetical protein n=1 Tax=Bradyrhizobium sp. SSUT77 TaxID=3040603 RepID=UPI00244C3429|nr:hypothetical protein [Bradyrhizobium sp. SSUT77]MDH2341536.1 hypothetical protein [Bradyrhizobium sp. SSUT77]
MTSTDSVRKEIERFLEASEPEVLCISGEWGVGKTYTWQAILDRQRIARKVGLWRYSYVSMFGINSLDTLKAAIFENMEILAPQGRSGFEWLSSGGNAAFKSSKQLASIATALPLVGNYVAKAQPLFFSSIRSQFVCIDDLERKGAALSVKDVLGLISFLREQRSCKVVLLLNQSQLDKDEASKKDFSDYFEKAIDTKLVFAPTTAEAIAIGIDGKDKTSALVRAHCETLEISNIRVLKKIHRLIAMLEPSMSKFREEVQRQFVHSTVMFGWSKFDAGANPPRFEYLSQGEMHRYLEHRLDGDESQASEEEQRWDIVLARYGWGTPDDLDGALLKFVSTSVLDLEGIEASARSVEENQLRMGKMGSLQSSWRLFHESFSDNEDDVCNAIIEGVRENFPMVSIANLDAAISVLRKIGREADAGSLIDFAEERGGDSFWLAEDPFYRKIDDERIRKIAESRREAVKPVFNFESDLLAAAHNGRSDKASLAATPVESYQHLFESLTGDERDQYIFAALEYRKISNATDDERTIIAKAEEALRRIGHKSKLNEIRIGKFGVSLGNDGASAG